MTVWTAGIKLLYWVVGLFCNTYKKISREARDEAAFSVDAVPPGRKKKLKLSYYQSVNFFYLPSEITQTILHSERMIRLGGAVKKYSVHYGATGGVSFILTDFSKEFQIHYYGILPNLFREGQDIIAEGRFDKNGVFVATRVLAKHDERYMPREMVERLKKNGLWEDYNRNAY